MATTLSRARTQMLKVKRKRTAVGYFEDNEFSDGNDFQVCKDAEVEGETEEDFCLPEIRVTL
eukprot:scaffold5466_cov90-Cylindrotheca_fusiformis.AAC.1